MSKNELLQQASKSAERLKDLSPTARENLRKETDWSGSRMGGYEFRSGPDDSKR